MARKRIGSAVPIACKSNSSSNWTNRFTGPYSTIRCATSTVKSYSGPTRSSWALRFQGLLLGVTSIASSRHYLFGFKIIWRRLTGYSGHRPANIVPFDRPVVTARRGNSPPPAFDDRAVCHSPVVAPTGDGRKADFWRSIVPHVKRQIFHAPIISITLKQIIFLASR